MRENRSSGESERTDLGQLYMQLLNPGPNGFGNEKSHDVLKEAYLHNVRQEIARDINADMHQGTGDRQP